VWADNLESEFAAMRLATEQYPFVSMVSARPDVETSPLCIGVVIGTLEHWLMRGLCRRTLSSQVSSLDQ
jgi:hypothetical protein